MKRRRYLILGAVGAVCTVIAGCIEDTEEVGDSTQDSDQTAESTAADSASDPAETVENFVNAVDAADRDTIDSLIHPNGELADEVDEYAEGGELIEVKSIRTETVAQADEEAFVDLNVEFVDEDGEDATDSTLYELQKDNGEWRIYGEPSNVPLEYRLEDVSPADSFETTIGFSESAAEPFFTAEDVDAVNMQDHYQDDDLVLVLLSFSEEKAEQMQQTATDLGDDLREAQIFEYLDNELIKTSDMSDGLAQTMLRGNWVHDPAFTLSYTDRDLAERVAKTVLTRVDD